MIAPGLGHQMIVWLLRNSAGAGIVALLVLLVQWMLGKRISARWRHNLWLLVIVRLVLPPLPTVKIPAIPHLALVRPLIRHLHPPIPMATPIPAEVRRPPIARSDTVVLDPDEPVPAVSPAPSNEFTASVEDTTLPSGTNGSLPVEDFREAQSQGDWPVLLRPPLRGEIRVASESRLPRAKQSNLLAHSVQARRAIPWTSLLVGTWGAVALLLLSKTLVGSLRVAVAVRRLRPVRDRALLELVHDCTGLLKLPRAPALVEGPHQSGPALVGFRRPKLLLPACVLDQFTWREVRHVVLHELVHLRRRDVLINYLASVALAVHWFNPLAWLAAARMRAERELACDEAVLALTPWREGRAYGSTIVKLLELLSRGAVPAGAMGVIGHKALMHRRIAMIARFDGSRRHWSASAILLSAAVMGAALAGVVRAQVQAAQERPATVSDRTADDPARQSDGKDVETKAADEPATEGKPGTSADEAGAQQAIRAEAGREEGSADLQPPPQPGNAPSVEINPQPHFPRYGPGAGVPGPAGAPQPLVNQGGPPQPLAGEAAGAAPPGAGGPFMPRPGVNPPSGMMQGAGPFGRGGGAPVAQLPGQSQVATIEDASAVKADAKTIEKLQRPMPMQVEGESFEDVLNMLAQKGGFDVLIDNRALGELNLIPQVQMNIREPQPIEQLLHFVLRQVGGDDVGFSVVHGVVMVSSKAALDRHVVTRVYDIRELGNPDDMQQTIEQTVGSNIAVRFVNGKMIVTTSEPNQREVSKLLAMLRQDGPRADATGAAPPPGQQTSVSGEQLSVYQLHHADAQQTAKMIQSKLAPGLTMIAGDPRTNSVVIAGTRQQVKEAGALIRSLDGASDGTDAGANPTAPPQPANR